MILYALLLIFIAIAAGLAWFLIAHDHGEHEPVGTLWIAMAFGVLAAFASSFAEALFITPEDLKPLAGLVHLFGATLIVGVVEESFKFIPLALFLWRKRYFNEHTDGVIYFALAGLGFGLPENILYTVQFGTEAGIGRVILTPFFHAALTATIGYVLIRRKLMKRSGFGVVPALAVAMVVHALYNFGLTAGRPIFTIMSVLITFALSAGLFVLYVHASEQDQDRGLSVVGHNAFCRSCGHPNPKGHLYCTQCGNNA